MAKNPTDNVLDPSCKMNFAAIDIDNQAYTDYRITKKQLKFINMENTTNLAEQIIETSSVFTETLRMENAVHQLQLNEAIAMTVHAFGELIALCKDAIAVGKPNSIAQGHQNLIETAQKALYEVQQTAAQPVTATPAVNELPTVSDSIELDKAVVQAIALSYHNAVNAQMQANVTLQAATTQIIATILSVATATLSIAVREAEQKKSITG